MSENNTLNDIIEALDGRPGQPILFGVCRTLAARWGVEQWKVRAGALIIGAVFTLGTLAAYIVLGLVLPETEGRTRGVFRGLCIAIREGVDRCLGGLQGNQHRSSH